MKEIVTKITALMLFVGALAVTTNHDGRGAGDIHFGPIPNEESDDKEPK